MRLFSVWSFLLGGVTLIDYVSSASSQPKVASTQVTPGKYADWFGSNDKTSDQVSPSSSNAVVTDTLDSLSFGKSEANKWLLDKVDHLRACGVDQYIDLPQIVVVGDQSAGKSSLLSALTNVPFPRSSRKCTRFATQIGVRRAEQIKRRVQILPGPHTTAGENDTLAIFEQTIKDSDSFGTIFELAEKAIFPPGRGHNFVSRHILSIEISGPEQTHLSVVDLPGFIRNAANEQKTDDMEAITALARSYIEKDRTIILPVIGANYDYVLQDVLTMAKTVDPHGLRTLGIITKPDKTESQQTEMDFIKLASNKDVVNNLELGWHVIRNIGPSDALEATKENQRRIEAAFFAQPESRWRQHIDPSHLGVDNLIQRLSRHLDRHVAGEIRKVKADIERELVKCEQDLQKLGAGNDDPIMMREELNNWCTRALSMAQAAIRGDVISPRGEKFFSTDHNAEIYARSLRSRIVIENRNFAKIMETLGSTHRLEDDDDNDEEIVTAPIGNQNGQATMKFRQYIDIVVRPMIELYPGSELPMDTNPLNVYRLFQSFSKHWEKHASQHIDNIHELCKELMREILLSVWPKQKQNRIWDLFIDVELENILVSARLELYKLELDRMRLVAPYENEFLQAYYLKRNPSPTNSTDDQSQANQVPSDKATDKYEDLMLKMLLLYNSRLKTFIANVIVQVVERHIADGIEGVFDSKRVRNLTEEQVVALVSDDETVRAARKELRTKKATLLKGQDICKEISMRSDFLVSTAFSLRSALHCFSGRFY